MAKTPHSNVLGRPPLPKQFQIVRTPKQEAKAKAPAPVIPAAAEKAKAELVKRMPELTETVDTLEVNTPEEYLEADEILGMIQTARKDWQARFYGGEIQGKTYQPIIPPMRSALDALYALVRDIDKPLAQLEAAVKDKQMTYKRAELEAQRALEAEQQAERDRIEQEKQRLLDAQEQARTPRQKATIAAQLSTLDSEAEAMEEEYVAPVQAANSSSRVMRTWRHTDMKKTMAAIKAGLIPMDVLQLDTVKVNAYYKEDAATVESWPGFDGFDDITIVGKRTR